MNTNPLTTVSLMLTLAGLVGSFFNVQLSQWLRDLLALWQKVDLNKSGGTDAKDKALVECRVELKKLSKGETYLVNFLVLAFVVFVLADGLWMIRSASAVTLYCHVYTALWVFLAFFLGMSSWLTFRGWRAATDISKILNPPSKSSE